jgi:hypothetical protein
LKIHINYQALIKVFIIFVYYPPVLIERLYPNIEIFFDICVIIITLITALYYFLRKIPKVQTFEIVLAVFIVYIIAINMFEEKGNIYSSLKQIVFPAVGAFFIFSYIFAHEAEKDIIAIGKYFAVLVWINFFIMIVYPQGVIFSKEGSVVPRANWLWGSKNSISQYIPVVFAFLFMGIESNGKKWLRWITIIVFCISVISMGSNGFSILNGSATALLMTILSVLLMLLTQTSHLDKYLCTLKIQ